MLPSRLAAALQAFRRARTGAWATVEPAAAVRHRRTLARRSRPGASPATGSVVRGTKKLFNIGDHMLFSIMMTEPNAVAEPIHEKAMPVI